jgi:hypothetical protein
MIVNPIRSRTYEEVFLPIKCVISGSFTESKYKIDEARNIFEASGIQVLSPPIGGLVIPSRNLNWSAGSYPLEDELYISEIQAKVKHIDAISQALLLYVVCGEYGRIGISTAQEIGTALADPDRLVFSDQYIPEAYLNDSFNAQDYINEIHILSPEEVVAFFTRLKLIGPDKYNSGHEQQEEFRRLQISKKC